MHFHGARGQAGIHRPQAMHSVLSKITVLVLASSLKARRTNGYAGAALRTAVFITGYVLTQRLDFYAALEKVVYAFIIFFLASFKFQYHNTFSIRCDGCLENVKVQVVFFTRPDIIGRSTIRLGNVKRFFLLP